jgi:predicted nucleic acid-binding protein
MIVVSNTSPLHYLVLIQADFILPALFGDVLVPPAVLEELTHAHTPEIVQTWASNPPSWLRIETPASIDPSLQVDRGEAAAISLAMQFHADALLIDDHKGRSAAKARHVPVVGTLMVLETAAGKGLINLTQTLDALRRTPFRASERLYQEALQRDLRKKDSPD